jgi:glutamate--cysteine ligase
VTARVLLTDWAAELLAECTPLAAALDAAHGGSDYAEALAAAQASAAAPDTLPSARVLAAMQRDFAAPTPPSCARSRTRPATTCWLCPGAADSRPPSRPRPPASLAQRRAIEAATTVDFEAWRLAYLAPERLRV